MENDRFWILLAKKTNNEATAEELQEFESLLQQKNFQGYNYEVAEKLLEKPLGFLPEMNLAETTWSNITSGINTSPKTFFLSYTKRWIAAALFIFAAATSLFFYHQTQTKSSVNTAENLSEVLTKPSFKRDFYLPDGSHVWLNGNSKITYNSNAFGTNKREVSLIGEGFFDVVKNAKVPFVIHAGVVNITVKGTAFNVKAYPGEKNIETTLLRGLIEITTKQNPSKKIYVKPNEKIIIPADITSTIINSNNADTTTHLFSITHVQQNKADKILPETAWMKEKLEFNNETFEELAPEMESWFAVHFQFENDVIKSKRFSGLIEKETLEETLKAMQLSYPFKYIIKGNMITIE